MAKKNISETIARMKEQTIGVEIEFTGITRRTAANVLAKELGATGAAHLGGCYDKYEVRDGQGRKWHIVYDSSIDSRVGGDKCELVTPILHYEDIEQLQQVVRALRKRGAISRPSLKCGIHIHIGADGHDAKTLRNLTNIMASKEDLLAKAIGVTDDRMTYCRTTSERFLKQVNEKKPKTMRQLESIWYGGRSQRDQHYSPSRYHMLNLHSVFSKGTIEFRCFNFSEPDPAAGRRGGIHAGQLKAYIQLCIAMSQMAKEAKSARPDKPQRANEKYALRTWMLRLGFIGDEFKTARTLLMKNLNGNSAWRHTGPMAQQQENDNRVA